MITQLRSFCIAAIALLVMSGCAPVAVEEAAVAESVVLLQPKRTATYTLMERGDDIVCGFDRAPYPLTVREDDLRTGEVGAGFRNWFRHEDRCRRRYTWVHQAFVAFDTQPLRDLGQAIVIRNATLRFHERPLSAGQPPQPVRSAAEGLSSTHCPMFRRPTESWEPGWHDVRARADLIETGRFPFTRAVALGLPGDNGHEIDVTRFVRHLASRPEKPFEITFESISDLFYQNNNEFCMKILGGFSVAIEYEEIARAEP